MIEDEILTLVDEHYKDPKADVLLLSNLGSALIDKGLWPDNSNRTLFDIVATVPNLVIVRDAEAKAFIPIAKKGDEKRIEEAFASRQDRQFLRQLPKALIFAFTLDVAAGNRMSIKLTPRLSYQAGPDVEQGAILVDEEFRCPGLDGGNLLSHTADEIKTLSNRIRLWRDRYNIDLSSLLKKPLKVRYSHPTPFIDKERETNALERLCAAQSPEVAKLMNIPVDIALILSRLP